MNVCKLNTESVPRELKFILDLLSDEKYITDHSQLDKLEWKNFLELVRHHRLYPLIYHKLKELPNSTIPVKIMEVLTSLYKQNTFQMLQLTAEINDLNKIMSEHDVRVIFLKGPTLAYELYQNLSMRTCSDIDVLIPLRDLGKTEEILRDLGFEKDDYIDSILGDWTWRHHHVAFFHKEKGVKLEVHWRLNPGPGFEPDFEELWNRRLNSKLMNQNINVLGREDLFFFLVTHGARHGWSRLRWLTDIQQLLTIDVDWEKSYKLLVKYKYIKVAGQAIQLANQLLLAKLPDEMKKTIDDKSAKLSQGAIFYLNSMINLHSDPVPAEVSQYHSRYLFSLMSYKQKLLYLFSCLYPFPEDAQTLPLPKKLHFLYFPLRPLLWFWRRSKKQLIT